MKQNHKKFLAICLSASLCSAALSGCGAKNTTDSANSQAVNQVQTTNNTQSDTKSQNTNEAQTENIRNCSKITFNIACLFLR